MDAAIEKRLFRVWLLLGAITILSWFLGSEGDAVQAGAGVTYIALAIAAFKVRVIIVEFMEARHSSRKLQVLMDSWLFLVVAGLMMIYALKLKMPPL